MDFVNFQASFKIHSYASKTNNREGFEIPY